MSTETMIWINTLALIGAAISIVGMISLSISIMRQEFREMRASQERLAEIVSAVRRGS